MERQSGAGKPSRTSGSLCAWSSLWHRLPGSATESWLSRWPIPAPADWVRRVNRPLTDGELEAMRRGVQRGQPYGGERWVQLTVKRLGLESSLRPRGRPRKDSASAG